MERRAEKKGAGVRKSVVRIDSCLSLIQLKIMDMAPAIFDLYTRCMSVGRDPPETDEARIIRTLEVTLQQS